MSQQQSGQAQLAAAQAQIQQLSQQLAAERKMAQQIQAQLQAQLTDQQQRLTQLEAQTVTYRHLFDSNPQPMWVYDLESLQFLAVNDAAVLKYGYSRAEFLTMTIADIRLPEDVPRLVVNLAQVNSRFGLAGICQHCLRDGRVIQVEMTSHPLEFEGRRAELVFVQDVTESITFEQTLRRNEARYQTLGQTIAERTATLAASEARLNFLLNASPATVYSCQPDGVFTCNFVSQAVETLLGYTPAEFYSESDFWMQLLHPDDAARVLAEILTLFNGNILKHEYRLRHRDGHYVWVRDELTLLRDPAGTPIAVVGFLTDICDRKQTELDLLAYAARVEDLYNNAPCGYCSLDADNRITGINNTALVWLDCSRDTVLGQPITQFMQPDSRPIFTQRQEMLAQPGQVKQLNYVITLLGNDGGRMPVLFSEALEKAADGTLTGSRITITDMRQRVKAERLVEQQLRRENLLRQITSRIRQSLDLSTIFTTACNDVRQALRADRVAIFRFYPESNYDDGEFIAESMVGDYPSVLAVPVHDHCFGDNFANLYAHGRYYAVADIEADHLSDCHADILRQFQVRANLVVPLVESGNTLWGLLCIHQCSQPRPWYTPDIHLAEELANQLAIAINQANLFEQLQQELRDRQLAEQQLAERNQQLALSNSELERATRLKDEFLANMSHELRTPLNAILGMTEALQDEVFGSVNDRQLNTFRIIENSGNHLLALINDILDLAKIASGEVSLEYSSVTVELLCNSSLTFVKQQAHNKQIRLVSEIPLNLENLWVDERRIRQVLINLLTNAVKFTPEGGQITLKVSVLPPTPDTPTAQYLRMAITDTGIGISPDNITKLFQPFVQIDSALNRQQTGTGLGLALVKQIVELHGGHVGLTSDPGVGSCFTIDLPYALPEQVPSQPAAASPLSPAAIAPDTTLLPSAASPATASLSIASPPISNTPPLILLAEDNPANVATISAYLQARGYRLITANDGQVALDLAISYQPDLILMDVQMPGMDGLEAIKQIRQREPICHIPIIVLTALVMEGDRERCLATGANYYLGKPIKLKQLDASIKELLVEQGWP